MIKRKVFKNGRNVLLQFIQYIHLAILQCHGEHAFATCKDIITPKSFGNNLCQSLSLFILDSLREILSSRHCPFPVYQKFSKVQSMNSPPSDAPRPCWTCNQCAAPGWARAGSQPCWCSFGFLRSSHLE